MLIKSGKLNNINGPYCQFHMIQPHSWVYFYNTGIECSYSVDYLLVNSILILTFILCCLSTLRVITCDKQEPTCQKMTDVLTCIHYSILQTV